MAPDGRLLRRERGLQGLCRRRRRSGSRTRGSRCPPAVSNTRSLHCKYIMSTVYIPGYCSPSLSRGCQKQNQAFPLCSSICSKPRLRRSPALASSPPHFSMLCQRATSCPESPIEMRRLRSCPAPRALARALFERCPCLREAT